MKVIYSELNALTIVLAGVIARNHPQVIVVERDNASLESLIEKFQELHPKLIVANLGITALLESQNDRGKHLNLALVALHHDLKDPENQHLAHELFLNNKAVIEKLAAEGKIIDNFIYSNLFRNLVSESIDRSLMQGLAEAVGNAEVPEEPTPEQTELQVEVTQETLELNPELKEQGVEVGETIGVTPESDVPATPPDTTPEPTPEAAPKKAGRKKKDA